MTPNHEIHVHPKSGIKETQFLMDLQDTRVPKIIALTAPKGVGKSTLARSIWNQAGGHKTEIMSFATPIKKMAEAILPPEAMTTEGKENADLGLCGKTPRHILQTLGSEWARQHVGEDIWCQVMRRKLLATSADLVVIDDLRYDNEAVMVRALGGVVIRLDRDGMEYTCEHPSECPISGYLVNAGVSLEYGSAPAKKCLELVGLR